MDANNNTMLSTPQRLPGDPEELAMIENLENELNTLADCLEKSNDKVRVQMRRIQEQNDLIANLTEENKHLQDENSKLRNLIDKHMKNFSCFTSEISKNIELEQENVSLHTKLDSLTTESHDKIIDLELEKDRLQKEVQTLEAQSKKFKDEASSLKKEFASLNLLIKENFEKTLTYQHTVEIQELNQALEEKNNEIDTLKSNFSKEKEDLEKELKQKKLELDLLRIDYKSAVMSTIHGKPIKELKEHTNHRAAETTGSRKIRQAKQKSMENIKKQMVTSEPESYEDEEEYYNPEESDDGEEEEEFDEEEDDDQPRKGGKRKASKPVKPKENKRVKKNENKDLMLATRNTIQYHLFN